jgi:hypothetical protein
MMPCAMELTQQVPPLSDAAGCHQLQRHYWPAAHEAAQVAEEGPPSMHCIEGLRICSTQLAHAHVAAEPTGRQGRRQGRQHQLLGKAM